MEYTKKQIENTKKWFGRANQLRRDIAWQEEKIEIMRAQLEDISPVISDMPKAKTNESRLEKRILEIVSYEQELEKMRDHIWDLHGETISVLFYIKSEQQRNVLIHRYINGYDWEQTTAECGLSELRSVHRLHNQAIEKAVIPVAIRI